MRVMLFGASGMVGQGVLRECLLDTRVEHVLAVVRNPLEIQHPKLEQLVHRDFLNYSAIDEKFSGYDACFFSLGVSAAGMKEAVYRRMTYDLTLAAANAIVRRSPGMTFEYVSGAGTDSTGKSRQMWARIKGETENALLQVGFRAAYMLRPGYIHPEEGIRSKTNWYNALYAVTTPLYPLMKKLAPRQMVTTGELGRVMLRIARDGAPKQILEAPDIVALARE